MHKIFYSITALALFLLLSTAQPVCSTDKQQSPKVESSVTKKVENGVAIKTVVNSSSSTEKFTNPDGSIITMLIKQTVKSIYRTDRESSNSKLKATAWVTDKKEYDTKLWTIKDLADNGGRWDDYYRTVIHGCCASEKTYRMFDYKTGKYIFSSSAEPASVVITNPPIKRTISYISVNSGDYYMHEKRKTHRDEVGILTMSSTDSNIDRIMIYADNVDDMQWSPKLSLIDEKHPAGSDKLEFAGSAGSGSAATVSGFSVKLVFFDNSGTAIIPIINDRLHIENAILSKGISLKRIFPAENMAK
ncbi:MAG: hypothetical protein OEV59_00975 [Deltaproteobacteria bacterium]|nr:hypothetical protein [Deltaproteobacteria bacterium]